MSQKSSFRNYRFEDLEVWKLGMQIVRNTYKMIETFPQSEVFGLTDQLRRAATSIVLNIAEGSGQSTTKSFALYLNRSKASTLECVACLKIAEQENFGDRDNADYLGGLLQEEYFKLIALVKSLKP